ELRARGLDPVENSEEYEAAWPEVRERVSRESKAEAEEVVEAGGLYVLGTERHESRRIDDQLRGRSGRHGDPGQSRFYLSLGDDLMRRFNAAMVERVMNTMNLPEEVPIEHKMVTRAIRSAQNQVEQQNMEIRKNVLKYDEVMNEQRKVVYSERRRVLEGEDLGEQAQLMLQDVIKAYVDGETSEGYAEDWDHKRLWDALKTLYPVGVSWEEIVADEDDIDAARLTEILQQDAREAYARREAEIDEIGGEGAMRELERKVMLSVVDRRWREHLYEMDYLKEGIGLRAMAQRDPLMEYKREGYDMFNAMLESLKEEAVGYLFNLQVERTEPAAEPAQEAATEVPESAVQSNGHKPAKNSGKQAQKKGGKQSGRHARAVPEQPQASGDEQSTPPALQGKGLNNSGGQAPMTYSGPAEGGGVESQGAAAEQSSNGSGTRATTRRERRAAEREQAKKNKRSA